MSMPTTTIGSTKPDICPTAFSAIYNRFVPDVRKQNVTSQIYMKNYIQESLRYLREKARKYENDIKNSSLENSPDKSKESSAFEAKSQDSTKSEKSPQVKQIEAKNERYLTPIKIAQENKSDASSTKISSNKSQQSVQTSSKSITVSNPYESNKRSHEKSYKMYNTVNQNMLKPVKPANLKQNLNEIKLDENSKRNRAKSLENYLHFDIQKSM